MSEVITAVYENGFLRPLVPLPLQEHQTVQLQILPHLVLNQTEQVVQGLVAAGLLTPPLGRSEIDPVSEKERRQLAEILGKASNKRLSEIIIEERGKW